MLASKTKGQISVEALIIVGVLVIGGVIFASVYLSNINSQTAKADDLSAITDDFMNDLGGWGTGTGSTPNHCGIDGCQPILGENNSNCSDCKCGDGFCLSPFEQSGPDNTPLNCITDCGSAPATFNNLRLELSPSGSTSVDTSFGIKVRVDSTYASADVGKLQIFETSALTDKCSYNGVYNDTFNDLGKLFSGVPSGATHIGEVNNIFNFNCNTPGTYTFEFSEITPTGLSSPMLGPATINKTITPATNPPVCGNNRICESGESCPTCPECCVTPTVTFKVAITSPVEGQVYFNDQSIQLTAVDANTQNSTGVVCNWYIGDTVVPANKSCDYSFNLNTIDIGEPTVTVYATKEIDGVTLSSKDERNIIIYKNDPTAIYLSDPGTQTVGKKFYLKVSSKNKTAIDNTTIGAITFLDTTCIIDPSKVTGTLTEIVNGVPAVYYKKFPTTCLEANYSGPDTLSPVYAVFNGVNTPFYVGYDTSLNFVACSENGSNYGLLKACILSSSGAEHNSDYYANDYGLLKVSVNIGEGSVTHNDYGTLSVYIE